jgi:hypothetical protein
MPVLHTSTDKVHLAAQPEGPIQRCARCGAKILAADPFWPTGAPVLSRRQGMRRLTAQQAAAFRPCGRHRSILPALERRIGSYKGVA